MVSIKVIEEELLIGAHYDRDGYIRLKSVGKLDPAFETMERLSVYCTALHEAFYGRENRMKEFYYRNILRL